jgi:hypothetical protein
MQSIHADKLKFRTWLVKQLKVSRWSIDAEEAPRDLANRLGVTFEVLVQAIEERAEERMARGQLPLQLGKRRFNRADYFDISITMPPRVHAPWTALCKALGVSSAMLLRSLIQQFLITGKRPTTIGKTWLYRGELHHIKPTGRLHAKTRITRGAQIALDDHADRWNTTATGIVRGIITDLLDRDTGPLRLKIVTFAEMWGDPERYLAEPSPDVLKAVGQKP